MNDDRNNPYFEKVLKVATPLSGIRLGLQRIESALALLGDPHTEFPCIIVGGTNGKGSTAAFTASILSSSGLRCGLYTSPHIHRYEERFRVNGMDVDPRMLDSALNGSSILSGDLPVNCP